MYWSSILCGCVKRHEPNIQRNAPYSRHPRSFLWSLGGPFSLRVFVVFLCSSRQIFRVSLFLKIGYLDLKVKSRSLFDEGLCKHSQVNSFFKATEHFRVFCSHLSLNWAGNILNLKKYTVWLLYAKSSARSSLYSWLLAMRLYNTLIVMSMCIISAIGFAEQNIWILLVLLWLSLLIFWALFQHDFDSIVMHICKMRLFLSFWKCQVNLWVVMKCLCIARVLLTL